MVKLTVLEPYKDEDGNEIVTTQRWDNANITFRGRNNRLEVADGARIDKLTVTFDCDNGVLTIGANPKVKGGTWGIRVGQDATVRIGDDVSTTGLCIVSAVEGATVSIGDDVMIASHNQIRSDDGHPIFDVRTGKRVNLAQDITIGDHVWLALGATVLAGGTIGEGSVIGYGAIVTGKVPNNCIAVGMPARVVRRDIAWERPHLSFRKPYYKPDASTVRKSKYWHLTEAEATAPARRPSRVRQAAGKVRRRLRRAR